MAPGAAQVAPSPPRRSTIDSSAACNSGMKARSLAATQPTSSPTSTAAASTFSTSATPPPLAPLPVRALNHVSYRCQSLPRSLAFYRNVLGFVPVKRPDQALPVEGAWLFNFGIGLHLIHDDDDDDVSRIYGRHHHHREEDDIIGNCTDSRGLTSSSSGRKPNSNSSHCADIISAPLSWTSDATTSPTTTNPMAAAATMSANMTIAAMMHDYGKHDDDDDEHGVGRGGIVSTAAKVRPINPKSNHISFQCDDMSSVQKTLQHHGIPFVHQQIQEGGVVVSQFFFHDPDGNMIEICDCHLLPVEPLAAAAVIDVPAVLPSTRDNFSKSAAAALNTSCPLTPPDSSMRRASHKRPPSFAHVDNAHDLFNVGDDVSSTVPKRRISSGMDAILAANFAMIPEKLGAMEEESEVTSQYAMCA